MNKFRHNRERLFFFRFNLHSPCQMNYQGPASQGMTSMKYHSSVVAVLGLALTACTDAAPNEPSEPAPAPAIETPAAPEQTALDRAIASGLEPVSVQTGDIARSIISVDQNVGEDGVTVYYDIETLESLETAGEDWSVVLRGDAITRVGAARLRETPEDLSGLGRLNVIEAGDNGEAIRRITSLGEGEASIETGEAGALITIETDDKGIFVVSYRDGPDYKAAVVNIQ